MQGFEVVYNNNQDRFQGIAVYTKVDTHIISHTKLTGASFITVLTVLTINIKFLSQYGQLVNNSTRISCSLLDHVYIV